MELAMPTFLWLRELGCVSTLHAVAGKTKGMISLSSEGLNELQCGKGIIRLLRHYCCHRFDIPEALHPADGDSLEAKRHNWSVISKILKDALDFDLTWERRELIISGDVVETVVLLKQVHELVKPHMVVDKKLKEKHRVMHDDKVLVYQKERLSRPLDNSDPAEKHQEDDGQPSPDRQWRVNMNKNPTRKGSSPQRNSGAKHIYTAGAHARSASPKR